MKKAILIFFTVLFYSGLLNAQTLFIPGGTSGIGNSSSTGNVGIGTSNPTRRLEITGSQADFKIRHSSEQADWGLHIEQKSTLLGVISCSGRDLQVTSGWTNSLILGSPEFTQYNGKVLIPGGKLGIGTSAPRQALHVTGRIYLEGTETYPDGALKNYFHWRGHSLILGTEEGQYFHNIVEIKPGGSTSGALESNLKMFSTPAPNNFELKVFLSSNGNSFINGGNVGIGTTNPGSYKLAVEGKIRAREINVTTAAWADYVFESNYSLRPLSQVESFIKENKHLPEVPSATEVQANGINLGEMNTLLLKKIEELTLYLIKQNEITSNQQSELDKLKSDLLVLMNK